MTSGRVQANSIDGCKMKEVDVVYTRWRNLKKTKSMEAGQVGFHDETKVGVVCLASDLRPSLILILISDEEIPRAVPHDEQMIMESVVPSAGPQGEGGEEQRHRQRLEPHQGGPYEALAELPLVSLC